MTVLEVGLFSRAWARSPLEMIEGQIVDFVLNPGQ